MLLAMLAAGATDSVYGDRFGRKPVLFVSLAGLCICHGLLMHSALGNLVAAAVLLGLSRVSTPALTVMLTDVGDSCERPETVRWDD